MRSLRVFEYTARQLRHQHLRRALVHETLELNPLLVVCTSLLRRLNLASITNNVFWSTVVRGCHQPPRLARAGRSIHPGRGSWPPLSRQPALLQDLRTAPLERSPTGGSKPWPRTKRRYAITLPLSQVDGYPVPFPPRLLEVCTHLVRSASIFLAYHCLVANAMRRFVEKTLTGTFTSSSREQLG